MVSIHLSPARPFSLSTRAERSCCTRLAFGGRRAISRKPCSAKRELASTSRSVRPRQVCRESFACKPCRQHGQTRRTYGEEATRLLPNTDPEAAGVAGIQRCSAQPVRIAPGMARKLSDAGRIATQQRLKINVEHMGQFRKRGQAAKPCDTIAERGDGFAGMRGGKNHLTAPFLVSVESLPSVQRGRFERSGNLPRQTGFARSCIQSSRCRTAQNRLVATLADQREGLRKCTDSQFDHDPQLLASGMEQAWHEFGIPKFSRLHHARVTRIACDQ